MYRPKVGEECLVNIAHSKLDNFSSDAFLRATVDFISDNGVVYSFGDGVQTFIDFEEFDINFRPLKSKRDEEIDDMVDVVFKHNGESAVGAFCETIYDAGYRKQMPYDLAYSTIFNYLYGKLGHSENSANEHSLPIAEQLGYTPEEN
jgi:hypothetical protein